MVTGKIRIDLDLDLRRWNSRAMHSFLEVSRHPIDIDWIPDLDGSNPTVPEPDAFIRRLTRNVQFGSSRIYTTCCCCCSFSREYKVVLVCCMQRISKQLIDWSITGYKKMALSNKINFVTPAGLVPGHAYAMRTAWCRGAAPDTTQVAVKARPRVGVRNLSAAADRGERFSNGGSDRALTKSRQRNAAWPFGMMRRDPWFASPFSELDKFFSDFDDVATRTNVHVPALDISETSESFLVSCELAGVPKENVKISLDDHVLTVQGDKKWEHEEKDGKMHRMERSYGSFSRSVRLPENIVDQSGIKASFKDGVLKVTIPKTVKTEPAAKEIPIESE